MFSDKNIMSRKGEKKELERENEFIKVKPAVDIYETKESIVIRAEMPNVDRNKIRVQVKDGLLLINAARKEQKVDGEYLIRETRDVAYERVFELGDDLDENKISASYRDGILEVTIGKKEKAKPKVIEIK